MVVMMSNLSPEDKKKEIINNEEAIAGQLARKVLEKPVPPIWMIFIPIFFVFHAWKIKQYSSGLKDFAKHYLISRNRAMDTAFDALGRGKPPEIEQLDEMAECIPVKAQPLYHTWMTLLVNRYYFLLNTQGNSHYDLIRSQYRTKSSYFLFCNMSNQAEHAYNLALLPGIEGDQEDFRFILERMKQGVKDHYQKEIKEIF